MQMNKVTFLPHNREVEVPAGENLIRAALNAGVHINASCGGEGVCGKCRVLIEQGEVAGGISERLSAEDVAKGYRLACLSGVGADVVVRIPVSPRLIVSVLQQSGVNAKRQKAHKLKRE